MIDGFYNTTFYVYRSQWTEDFEGNPYSEQSYVTDFEGHIQQAQPELAQHLGLSFTKVFAVWCPRNTDVKEGDVLTGGGRSYTVRAKQENYVGDNKHIELGVEVDTIVEGS